MTTVSLMGVTLSVFLSLQFPDSLIVPHNLFLDLTDVYTRVTYVGIWSYLCLFMLYIRYCICCMR